MVVLLWIGFIAFILAMLALDLGVFHPKAQKMSVEESIGWTFFWVLLSLIFNVGIYGLYEQNLFQIGEQVGFRLTGAEGALKFFTGYIIEKSLSLDNIFVIAMIFSYFQIPLQYQHRVLFWGILGAIVLRGVMISFGVVAIQTFSWMVYVFGILLIWTAIKMLIVPYEKVDPESNWFIQMARKLYPVTTQLNEERFFVTVEGRRTLTPLFLALLLVESSDVLFAVDSIPAIFAITHDPFLIFTSNICAILGLRALYFVLAGIMEKFRYLKFSLVFLLIYIGIKMMLTHHYQIPTTVSLAIIGGILGVGVLTSLYMGSRNSATLNSLANQEGRDSAVMTGKNARLLTILVFGSTVALIGSALAVIPHSTVFVIPVGLAFLGTEFAWARWMWNKTEKPPSSNN